MLEFVLIGKVTNLETERAVSGILFAACMRMRSQTTLLLFFFFLMVMHFFHGSFFLRVMFLYGSKGEAYKIRSLLAVPFHIFSYVVDFPVVNLCTLTYIEVFLNSCWLLHLIEAIFNLHYGYHSIFVLPILYPMLSSMLD